MAVIPVFVSSTFRDFHAERDELISTVLPALNEQIAQYGCRAEMIDLRWGVTTADEDERQARVLEVCLKEIQRARPLFVGLLGDRYGWIPEEFRLANAAQEAGISDYQPGVSVTALEFEYGALRAANSDAVFLEREVDGPVPAEWRDPDLSKADALKARVREHCEVHRYRVQSDGTRPIDLADFVECACRAVGAKVTERAREIAGIDVDPVTAAESLFFEDRLRAFDGRTELVAMTVDRIRSGIGLCLVGESGVGKSAIWCAAVRKLFDEGLHVIAVPVAASPEVTTLQAVFLRICAALDVDTPVGLSVEELERFTRSALESAVPIILAIDGLDQLAGRALPTFLANLPAGVTVLFSTTELEHARYASAIGISSVDVAALTPTDSRTVIESICASMGRTLPPPAIDRLAAEPRTPLWLRLAVGELTALGADDFTSIDPNEDPSVAIERLVTATVNALPASSDSLTGLIVDRAVERFGEPAIRTVLSLAAVSRSGLRPFDLEELTGLDVLTVAGIRRAVSSLLVPRGEGGRLGFSHALIRAHVVARFIAQHDQAELHRRIASHFAVLPEDDPICAEDRLWHLFRSTGTSAAPMLNQVPRERASRLAHVVVDSASVPDLGAALLGLDDHGINFVAFTVHEHKAAMRSVDRISLCIQLLAVARRYYEAQHGSDVSLRSLSGAASCVADMPSVSGLEQQLKRDSSDALSFARDVVARHPESVPAHEVHGLLAIWFSRDNAGDARSLDARRDAAQAWQWVAAREPSVRANMWLQFALTELATAEQDAGNLSAARDALVQAHRLTREVLDANPENPDAMVNVINVLFGLGTLADKEGDSNSTMGYLGEAVQLAQKRYSLDPGRSSTEQLAITSRAYALALFDTEHLSVSRDWMDFSERQFRTLAQLDPGNMSWGFGADATGRAAAADIILADVQKGRDRMRSAVQAAPDASTALGVIVQVLKEIAGGRMGRGDSAVAEFIAAEAIQLMEDYDGSLDERDVLMQASLFELRADAQIRQNMGDAAAASFREAIALRRRVLHDTVERGDTATVRRLGVALLQLAGQVSGPERVAVVREGAVHWSQHLADDHGDAESNIGALPQLLATFAGLYPDESDVLLSAAARYADALVAAHPGDDEYLAHRVGIADVSGVVFAKNGDVDNAARQWIAAAEMAAKHTTDPNLLGIQRSVAVNLNRVSGERSLNPALASACSKWAERLWAGLV